MLDPDEGLDAHGYIVTGVARERISTVFRPVLDDIVASVGADVSVYVYGSAATGRARVGASDVDIVTLGLDPTAAGRLARDTSARYSNLTRDVGISAWSVDDLGDDDAGHGNQAFLKHYCAWLAGPDPAATLPRFRGDKDAARGFNGDFPAAAIRWGKAFSAVRPAAPDPLHDLARRVGRKSLFAVAGMVSVHDATWTTDRTTAARRWGQLPPSLAADLATLLTWGDMTATPSHVEVGRMLNDTIPTLTEQFVTHVGAWSTAG